ncbi:MAG TPA: TetR/AcrR family transcriptional regulator [Vicinamibacterales bacterium]|jgi:AcrR family transcriptional regulator|nr:TetR/AcrR family transcriptional regulator [Vicinamibacterales bacterium]
MKLAPRHSYTMRARAESMTDTRDRIVRAALKLVLEQAYEDVTLVAIAEAAGVSHQTVLNHFASKENVAAAAAELLGRQTQAARDKAAPDDPTDAIQVLVGEYERFGDANVRWAVASDRLGSLAPLLDDARAGHQAWLERIFGARLPESPLARRRAIHALHAATDVYTWKLLRRDLRLSRADTERVLLDLVNGVLGGTGGRPRGRRERAR